MRKVILFDLDGTLLPMDQDEFVRSYFVQLAGKLAPHGYGHRELLDAVWKGMGAMIRNDGRESNEQAFWRVFQGIFGESVMEDYPVFEEFYQREFENVRAVCGFAPQAARVVHALREAGCRVSLATNPLFPAVATNARIRWAGLAREDFELVTTYENSRFCKPNLDYYREIVSTLGVRPEECLMVGNDVSEDMVAEELGMEVFLLTDCLINKDGADISRYPSGGFEALRAFLGQ